MGVYDLKKAYLKLPAKYQIYGDMPTQIEMQEAIDRCMLYGTREEIAEFEKRSF